MRKGFYLLFIFYCLLSTVDCFPQQSEIDAHLILLKTDRPDTNKLIHLYNLSDKYETLGNNADGLSYGKQAIELADVILGNTAEEKIRYAAKKYKAKAYQNIGIIYQKQGNYPEALKNYQYSLKIKEKIGDKKGLANSYANIGIAYKDQGNYSEALKNLFTSVEIKKEIGDKAGIAANYNSIGLVYYNQGNYPEALANHLAALKIMESNGDKAGLSHAYNGIGLAYDSQGNSEEALKNYLASLKMREEIGDKKGIAYSHINIGSVYDSRDNDPEALKHYRLSLKISEEIGDKKGIATSFNNIGTIYYKQGNYPGTSVAERDQAYGRALENFFTSVKMKEAIGDKAGIAGSYFNIGNVYSKQKKYKEANEYLSKAKDLSHRIGVKETIKNTYLGLVELDSARGNFKGAYENHKLYILYRDSLDNEETRKKTIQSQMTFDFEKKEAIAGAEHKKELENQEVLAEEKSRKQKVVLLFVVSSLLLVVVFAGFVFRSLRITRKQKDTIEEQKNMVEKQKQEVEQQKHLVEEHQKEIIDSIKYARRIQRSQLPTETYIDRTLKRLMSNSRQ